MNFNLYCPLSMVTGSYVFIETSAPRRPGDKAEMLSATFNGGVQQCLKFFYHMFGADTGTLTVQVCMTTLLSC